MPTTSRLRKLEFGDALAAVDRGAAFVDLRPVDSYLEVHIPGSLALLYEFGPGMASRARDCLPLTLPLVLVEYDKADMANAAASLKGKGFEVLGSVEDGINQWAATRGSPLSTEVVSGTPQEPLLDVGDAGASAPDGATFIPIESLWGGVDELGDEERVTVVAGYGVRAALAVGILERAEKQVLFWRNRA